MRAVWNKALVYLARLGAPGVVRRTAIVCLAGLAVVVAILGYWGWAVFERSQPGIEFDRWTRLYRTQTLFTAEDGSLLKVPWQLDVARLLAPMVLLGFGALAVFNLASVKIQRFGVRHAKGHVLFIGQPARLERLGRLLRKELPSTVAVYAVPDASKVESACLRMEVDLDEDEWPTKTSASSARAIVVAVQDDDRAVALATLAAERFPDAQLVVDVGSVDTMRWLGLWMMTAHPTQDIRVISIDQADSYVQAGLSGATQYQAVVVAGAEAGSSRIVTELLGQMNGWSVTENDQVHRPLLFIVDGDRPGVRSDVNDGIEVEAGDEFRAIEACGQASTRVLALGRSGMKTAMRIAAAIPGSEFVRLDADGFDGRQLVEEVAAGDIDDNLDGLLHGPLRRLVVSAVAIEHDGEAERHDPDALTQQYARRVAALRASGFRVVVEPATPPYVPRTTVEQISECLHFRVDDDHRASRALVHGLAAAGYRLAPPHEPDSLGQQTRDVLSLTVAELDDLVEDVAKFNHEVYCANLVKNGEADNASNVPWGDLPPDLRQQNFRQVRHVIDFLQSKGFLLRRDDAAVAGERLDEITEGDWHEFGRREHDRWALNKVKNGFVWGPERRPDSTSPPQPHPDLIDYVDLPPATQEKDYEPIVHAVKAFHSAGFVWVKAP